MYPSPAVAIARGGELAAEEAAGRGHVGQCRVEGSGIKKMVTPGAKREAVAHAREHHGVSERRACVLFGVSRRVIRYESSRPDDGALRQRLRELDTRNNRDFGSALTGFAFDGLSVGI